MFLIIRKSIKKFVVVLLSPNPQTGQPAIKTILIKINDQIQITILISLLESIFYTLFANLQSLSSHVIDLLRTLLKNSL